MPIFIEHSKIILELFLSCKKSNSDSSIDKNKSCFVLPTEFLQITNHKEK